MAKTTIYLANKNYSSWSLRAWLMLRRTGEPFEEVVVPLREAGTRETILRYSPSAKLPALHHAGRTIWDSLAIGEYLAETFPAANLWPKDAAQRAAARSVSAEMHSGFLDLRRGMPMNIRRAAKPVAMTDGIQGDINRITAIWRNCRGKFAGGGPFLFGGFTIADAMYAPVVSRFRTYGVELEGEPREYAETVWSFPDLQLWCDAAMNEPWIVSEFEI